MMRLLRTPFQLVSFLVAVWMAWAAWASFRGDFFAGTLFLLISCLFFVTSVRLGKFNAKIRKHREERKMKKRKKKGSEKAPG